MEDWFSIFHIQYFYRCESMRALQSTIDVFFDSVFFILVIMYLILMGLNISSIFTIFSGKIWLWNKNVDFTLFSIVKFPSRISFYKFRNSFALWIFLTVHSCSCFKSQLLVEFAKLLTAGMSSVQQRADGGPGQRRRLVLMSFVLLIFLILGPATCARHDIWRFWLSGF